MTIYLSLPAVSVKSGQPADGLTAGGRCDCAVRDAQGLTTTVYGGSEGNSWNNYPSVLAEAALEGVAAVELG